MKDYTTDSAHLQDFFHDELPALSALRRHTSEVGVYATIVAATC